MAKGLEYKVSNGDRFTLVLQDIPFRLEIDTKDVQNDLSSLENENLEKHKKRKDIPLTLEENSKKKPQISLKDIVEKPPVTKVNEENLLVSKKQNENRAIPTEKVKPAPQKKRTSELGPYTPALIDPHSIPKDARISSGSEPLACEFQEIICFVGLPVCGKSSFAQKYLSPNGYFLINQSNTKSSNERLTLLSQQLESGKSVVIDDCNPSLHERRAFIELALKNEVRIRCFYFCAKVELANFLNKLRREKEGKFVPETEFEEYLEKFEMPKKRDGFTAVKIINFRPEFKNKAEEEMFYNK